MKTFPINLLLIICGFALPLQGQPSAKPAGPSAAKVIEAIIEHTKSPVIPNTVDVIKEGDPETTVTGIITTMFGTMEVLRKAVEMKCNLIVVHEPLYYNHLDNTSQFRNDPVFLEKQKFINDHKLVVWRFHDYIHSIRPDGIMTGMVRTLGWNEFVVNGDLTRFKLPETSLEDLLRNLKMKFNKNAFYVIGNPEMKLTRVRLLPGAPGSMAQIGALRDENTDVVIAGEVNQWETYEYARDAVSQGKKKAIIFLGHVASEESGMKECAVWLKGFIKDVPVSFVESGPSYWSF